MGGTSQAVEVEEERPQRGDWERKRVSLFYEMSKDLEWTIHSAKDVLAHVFETLDRTYPEQEMSDVCPTCGLIAKSLQSLRAHITHVHKDFRWGDWQR